MKTHIMKHSEMAAMPPRTPPTMAPIGGSEVVDEAVDDWDASGVIDEVAEMEDVVKDVVEDSDAEALSSLAWITNLSTVNCEFPPGNRVSFWLVKVTLCTPGVSKVLEYKTTGGFLPSSVLLTASMVTKLGLSKSQSIHIAYHPPQHRRIP